MPAAGADRKLSIVSQAEPGPILAALREWLRNERRLGVPHWAVSSRSSQSSSAPSSPAPVARARARASEQPPAAGAAQVAERSSTLQAVPPTLTPVMSAAPGGLFADDPNLPPVCQQELSPAEAEAALTELDTGFVRKCTKCRLHEHRTQTVFGVGNPRPTLVFVGEGPGYEEDVQGLPFVGRAGQLLTRMIAAMTLTREQVYICNVVKCRPPENRTPLRDEMETCSPYLFRQLAILRPKVIVALGRPASQTLLATDAAISKLRGQFLDFRPPMPLAGLSGVKIMPTFHPAYLLRNPAAKGEAWADLQQVMRFLGLTRN